MTFSALKTSLESFFRTERGARVSGWLRRLFLVVIYGLLVYQLTTVGWTDIARSLPTAPVFYLVFLFNYFSLPITEIFIYRSAWGFPFWAGLSPFLKKRVYNKDVLGYSGEVYLYVWARQALALPDRLILGTVKDNAIVSSIASTLFAVGVLGVLFFTGRLAFGASITQHDEAWLVGIGAVSVVLTLLGIKFRRSIFRLSGRQLALILMIHTVRLSVLSAFQVIQWMSVIPGVDMKVWYTFLALQIVTSRIPLIPGRDLIFLGASVELSRVMDVSSAAVAGMMLVSSVLDKGLNFILFTGLSFAKRRGLLAGGEVDPATAPVAEIDAAADSSVEAAEPAGQARTL